VYPKLSSRLKEYDDTGFEKPEFTAARKRLQKEGRKVLNFQVGCPVRPKGYENARIMTEELLKAAEQTKICYPGYHTPLPYPGSPKAEPGIENALTEAIIRREKIVHGVTYQPGNVHYTAGSGGAITLFYFAVAEPAQEWLCLEPIYANYMAVRSFPPFSFKWTSWKQDETKEWTPDVDELRSKITEKSVGILMVNPCNPTGAVFSKKVLKDIIDVAGEHNLLIQVDEVMDLLPYDGSISTSIAEVAGDVPVVTINGFSKSMMVPGHRIGWLSIHDPKDKILDVRRGITKAFRVLGSYQIPTVLLIAATNVLNKTTDFQAHLKPTLALMKKRADYASQRINEIEGLSMVPPKAGLWGFAKYQGLGKVWKDDSAMALDLLQYGGGDKGVSVTAGPSWGPTYGIGHFRVPAYESEDVLEEAFDRLGAFFRERLK
jgi:aspartate/methionine/tyrosine aminotransferase